MGCSRSYIYDSLNAENREITPAEEYLQIATRIRVLGEYFEGGGHDHPIDKNHCKNCFDIYDEVIEIESKYRK